MTVRSRFSLDTNILVYAVDRDAGERHRVSRELIGRAARCDCVLTVQALAEFFHATTRKNLLDPERAGAFLRGWRDVFEVTAADDSALIDAVDAVGEHRFSFCDAMLWSTARRSGCSAILTENMQHGRRLGGVAFLNPFAADAATRLAPLLDP
ncbi:MAG: PIN domain-containing protein [Defluviicoccus sp.]|nr:PIN domain-containing protein [Defluviicoccus sp.]MDE0386314.1 PIN domain-containing protein [Defluviicoccus sp.]